MKVNSPYIVKLVDKNRTENYYYLFFEFCNGGDLDHYV